MSRPSFRPGQGSEPPGGTGMVGRLGDRQDLEERLDPVDP